MNAASFRRHLLAKRFLSLEEFRHEMLERWSKNLPATTSKAIPVPLHPGESIKQYTHKFKQWLAAKDEDLSAMRSDPNRERSFWHSFAHHRVGTFSTTAELATRGRKRSIEAYDEEDKEPYYWSTLLERKRARHDESAQQNKSFRSTSPPARVASENRSYDSNYRAEFDDPETLLRPRPQTGLRSGRVFDDFQTFS